MADPKTGRPGNIGEVFFKALGTGLANLPPLLEQQRQQKLEMLQFEMDRQIFDLKKQELSNQIEAQNLQLKESNRLLNMTPEDIAAEKAQAKVAGETTALLGAIGEPLSGIVEAVGAKPSIGQLLPIFANMAPPGTQFKGDMFNLAVPGGFPGADAIIFEAVGNDPEAFLEAKLRIGDFAKATGGDSGRVSATTQAAQAAIMARGNIEREEKKLDALTAERSKLRVDVPRQKEQANVLDKQIADQEAKIAELRKTFADSLQANVDIFSGLEFGRRPVQPSENVQIELPPTTEGAIKVLRERIAKGEIVLDDISPANWDALAAQGYNVKKMQKELSK